MRIPLLFLLMARLALAADPTPSDALASLTWLEGAWGGTMGQTTVLADYTSPAGGSVLSTTKNLRDGVTVSFEFEHFGLVGGALVYTPYPGGVRSDPFAWVPSPTVSQRIEFANAAHDFPTEFVFERKGDTLTITLSGRARGSDKVVSFELTRR